MFLGVLLLQVYDKFAELVAVKVSALKVGDGSYPETTHGPLITPAGIEKVGSDLLNIFSHTFLVFSCFQFVFSGMKPILLSCQDVQ